jgi:hypothetical protein
MATDQKVDVAVEYPGFQTESRVPVSMTAETFEASTWAGETFLRWLIWRGAILEIARRELDLLIQKTRAFFVGSVQINTSTKSTVKFSSSSM